MYLLLFLRNIEQNIEQKSWFSALSRPEILIFFPSFNPEEQGVEKFVSHRGETRWFYL